MLEKNAKILVLGRGLLGSAFIKLFNQKGFTNVTSVNRSIIDLEDQQETIKFFEETRPDIVINAAGKVGGIIVNRDFPADFMTANIAIQLNTMIAAQQVGIKKFIFFGSSCMYPKLASQPMKEDVLFKGVPEPTSMGYAVSKMAGMQMCLAFNQQYGQVKFLPVIPNSMYGPYDNFSFESGHVLSVLIKRFHEAKENGIDEVTLWGNGSSKREFIHSSDVAKACLHLLQSDISNIGFPINIGIGEDISIKDLALLVADTLGYNGKVLWDESKPNGTPQKLLDSSKMNSTGWAASVKLEEGIKETYEWYKQSLTETLAIV